MQKTIVTLLFSVFPALAACGATMKQYDKSDVEILSVRQLPSGGTEILYRPILDSLYYCPGARLRQDAGRQKISFVRCGIKEKCEIDVRAERVDKGAFKLLVPFLPENIDMVFGDGEAPLRK